MKNPKHALIISIAGTVLAPVLAVLLVPPPSVETPLIKHGDFHPMLITSTIFAWLHISAALIFLSGLDGFTERLKRNYRLICIGLLFLGIGLAELPVIFGFNQLDSWWAQNGGLPLPSLIAEFMLFAGLSSLAKTLHVKSLWVSPWPAAIATAVMGIGSWLAARAGVLTTLGFGDSSLGLNVACTTLALINVVLAVHIKRAAGPSFTRALAWFLLALVATLLAQAGPAIYEIFSIQGNPLITLAFILAGILFVKASLAFNKIKDY